MDIQTPSEPSNSIADRARAFGTTVVGRAGAVVDSGKQLVTDRLDARRRDGLLRELGALHFAASRGDDLDLTAVEALVSELTELEDDATDSDEADDA